MSNINIESLDTEPTSAEKTELNKRIVRKERAKMMRAQIETQRDAAFEPLRAQIAEAQAALSKINDDAASQIEALDAKMAEMSNP